jgi:predicted GTPase
VLILGAAGRDFHNFATVYRDDPAHTVVAFTAAQIPGIAGRRYPASLAGPRYPDGIPIEDERDLELICRRERVDLVVFAYSDVSHRHVMALASRVLAAGADFALLGPARTTLRLPAPVVAVSAVRTGCGKSPIARWLATRLRRAGRRVAVVRHPMPYRDLERQRVQRFAATSDLDDFPFFQPDLHIVVADALRPHDAAGYYPGEAVLRTADVVVVNKADAASPEQLEQAVAAVRGVNAIAPIVRGASPVRLDDGAAVRGRRVLVVEDGPTITHGSMPYGAGLIAARAAGAAEIVDPRASAAPPIHAVFTRHLHIGPVLPAVGYDAEQVEALRQTIERARVDVVVSATPVDLSRLLAIDTPVVRARYEFAEMDEPGLGAIVDAWLERLRGAAG